VEVEVEVDGWIRSRAVMRRRSSRRRHRGWMNGGIRDGSSMHRFIHSIVDGGARARTTRGRRDDERAKKNIPVSSSRAREGETRRGIEETRD
jgi:hypothetical protein